MIRSMDYDENVFHVCVRGYGQSGKKIWNSGRRTIAPKMSLVLTADRVTSPCTSEEVYV